MAGSINSEHSYHSLGKIHDIYIISKVASYIVTSTFSRKLKCSAVFMFAGKLYGNDFFVAGALSLPHCSDVVGCGAGLLLSLVLPLSILQGKGWFG